FDGVSRLPARLPPGGLALTGLTGEQLNPVSHHESRIKTDTKLTDQLLRSGRVLGLTQLLTQLAGARLGERANQVHNLRMRHTDAVIANGQGTCRLVNLDLNMKIRGVDIQVLIPQRLDPQLIQRIRSVRDQLPQKRILVGVDRVDHQIQQLTRLGLKLQLLDI